MSRESGGTGRSSATSVVAVCPYHYVRIAYHRRVVASKPRLQLHGYTLGLQLEAIGRRRTRKAAEWGSADIGAELLHPELCLYIQQPCRPHRAATAS